MRSKLYPTACLDPRSFRPSNDINMPATIMIVTPLKNFIVYRIRVENLDLTFGVLKTLLLYAPLAPHNGDVQLQCVFND